jgi:23S rRNA (uracil1939-C5)-methyltransferase
MGRSRRVVPSAEPVVATIDSMSQDGRGVTHVDGKAVFIPGSLPGERVAFVYTRTHRRYDEGAVREIQCWAAQRVVPPCPHFGVCGGCSLQHLDATAQVEAKQDSLLQALERIGKVRPEALLPPLRTDPPWGYRRKARLGVKYVEKKGRVLVGFRERNSPFIADIDRCAVLHPRIGERLLDLAGMIAGLSIRDRIPQIELAMGDDDIALVFRVLAPPTDSDAQALLAFGAHHGLPIYLQTGGPETIHPLSPGAPGELSYRLPGFAVEIAFRPTDFTQVNLELNRLMVTQALELLDPQPTEGVLDLFCGVGNFTLPLARRAGTVVGVEGDAGLVEQARRNAQRNRLDNVEFFAADLYADLAAEPWLPRRFTKALLDPPRSGAFEILPRLPQLGVERLVYISCFPSTLARDAGRLVELGYRLRQAGVMDMFPHTSHVESIALFERAR